MALVQRLEAENERLREALKNIADAIASVTDLSPITEMSERRKIVLWIVLLVIFFGIVIPAMVWGK